MNGDRLKLNIAPIETSVSLRTLAYDALKKAITEMDIYGHPDEIRLDERQLSQDLGVSRTPIREAIRDLTAEGLVDFDSYRSSVVHAPTLDEAQEVYELRLILEPIAVRRAVENITDAELARARELHEAMLATTELGDWVDLNRDFHATLTDPADSPRLLSIITALRNAAAIQVAMSLRARVSQLDEANQDHGRIIGAYARRDADAAVDIEEQHLRSTLRAIEAYENRNLEAPPAA